MKRIVINPASEKHKRLLSGMLLYASLAVVFVFFNFFYRNHLLYLEQIQLFRFNTSYVAEFFTIPGGFINLLEAFIVQFFHIGWLGALILTLLSFLAFKLTSGVLRKSGINGILFSLLPVLILTALHSQQAESYHTWSSTGRGLFSAAAVMMVCIRVYISAILIGRVICTSLLCSLSEIPPKIQDCLNRTMYRNP
jgi:hypothetical protein